jgi:hypothetical protein
MDESKYIMSIIKIPIEIFTNGKTVTHDDKMQMEFEEIDKLPEHIENKPTLNIFDKFLKPIEKTTIPDTPSSTNTTKEQQKTEENPIKNAIEQIFKNQIFVKKEEIQKKQKKLNTTFKNKKSKVQKLTQKMYPTNNDQDVDLVQPPMGQEPQQEDGQ